MSISIISSNIGGQVGVAYSYVNWLDNNDESQPSIDLHVHHLNEGPSASKPVLFAIHGGGWFAGSRLNFDDYKPKFFNELGMIYVGTDYRLARPYSTTNDGQYADWDVNRVKFPVIVEDCANALKWVYDNISDYGGDPNRIIILGHSAGAHLSLLLSTNTDYINAVGIPTSSIKSCISVDTSTFNIQDSISNPDATGGLSDILCRNAFGVEYDASRASGFNDFVSVGASVAAYTAGSPDMHVSSGIVTNFLLCIQGNATRRQTNIDFINSLSSVGVGTSLCMYFSGIGLFPTYNHEEMNTYIGSPIDIPPGNTLPNTAGFADVGISTFISRYLGQIGII